MAMFLDIAGAVFVTVQIVFFIYGRTALVVAAGGLGGACFLAAGILDHHQWTILLAMVNIAVVLLYFWRGGPRGRHRSREALGDESRQLRDGLIRRMRERRTARPKPSPQPSR